MLGGEEGEETEGEKTLGRKKRRQNRREDRLGGKTY